MKFLRASVGPFVVLLVVLMAWYALAYGLDNNFSPASGKPLILPPPHRLFEDLGPATRERMLTAIGITARTSTVGLATSAAIGIVLGFAMSRRRWLERSLWPWLVALQVTPIVALVPLIIRLVGANDGARLLVTVLITFFPIVSSTLFGFRSVSANLHDLFSVHRAGPLRRLLLLELPAARPSILNGLRTSAGLAVIGAIVGDFFFSRGDPGLGKLIQFFFLNNLAGPMFVSALIASGLGFTFFAVFELATRRTVGRWHEGAR
jgi:NitT/TauT family transport system permease protein